MPVHHTSLHLYQMHSYQHHTADIHTALPHTSINRYQETYQNYFGNPHKIDKYTSRPQQNTSVALLALLLGGDIELNPGLNDSTISLCGYCQIKVEWKERALGCDNEECKVWFHKACLEMCSTEYYRLEREGSRCAWICNPCDVPNYSSDLFRHYKLELSNSFTILGEPNTRNLPNKGRNWRFLIVNINGLRGKSSNLQTVVDIQRQHSGY